VFLGARFFMMKTLLFLSSLSGLLTVNGLPTSPCVIEPKPPIARLDYSTYQGNRLGTGVDEYLGMRFAAPPVGDLRFRAPQDPVHTAGVQDATTVSWIDLFLRVYGQKRTEQCELVTTNLRWRWSIIDAEPNRRLPFRQCVYTVQCHEQVQIESLGIYLRRWICDPVQCQLQRHRSGRQFCVRCGTGQFQLQSRGIRISG
jgi:hypothetical protein